eukprot:365230-Chlamydomonas_euryale.AAC.2
MANLCDPERQQGFNRGGARREEGGEPPKAAARRALSARPGCIAAGADGGANGGAEQKGGRRNGGLICPCPARLHHLRSCMAICPRCACAATAADMRGVAWRGPAVTRGRARIPDLAPERCSSASAPYLIHHACMV